MRIEHIPPKELRPYARNARTHSETQVAQIAASIQEFGFNNPILVDSKLGIIAGHGRWEAAEHLGLDKIPVIRLDHLTDSEKKAYIIADNRLALNAGWDEELLALELRGLEEDVDLSLLGFEEGELARFLDEDGAAQIGDGGLGSMADRFIVPPFSVLDARAGYWKERKDRWLSLGIRSEEGRGENLLKFSDTVLQPDPAKRKQLEPNQHLPALRTGTLRTDNGGAGQGSTGTSVFDPVLCELAYRWFCPPWGKVLDPFAGGSVRGIVAGKLGRAYLGIDLREEQVEANRAQADVLFPERPAGEEGADPSPDFGLGKPEWVAGDSREKLDEVEKESVDFIFSCPPYAYLEQYGDDERDLSNLPYDEFLRDYRAIIKKSVARLKPDRFAAFVVGEIRQKDSQGNYQGFVADTIEAFGEAGAPFYNEAILVTPLGTLPVRPGIPFKSSRKLGKTHQNLLVFCKGNAKKATEAVGEVEVVFPEE